MTNQQSSFYTTLRRVLVFLKKSLPFFEELTVMPDMITELETNLNEIDTLKEQQGTDISGLGKQKKGLRKTAIQKALEISKAALVYANKSKDEVLANTVNYTETDLKLLSDNDLDTALSVIYTAAQNHQRGIAAYGVSVEKVTAFKTAIDAFKAAISLPKDGSITKSQTTGQIKILFGTLAILLDDIDLLMDTFKFTNPALYAEYQKNRKVESRSASLTANMRVTDNATGVGIPGVNVIFELDGEVKIEKSTAAAGRFNVKSLTEGIYTITCSKIGYQTQTLTMSITNDELNAIEVALEKAVILEKVKA